MGKQTEQLKDKMYNWMLEEMQEAEVAGVPVCVDGVCYSLENADELKEVMENHYYMKSYIGNDEGKIVRIEFEQIVSF